MKGIKAAETQFSILKSLRINDSAILNVGTECYLLYKSGKDSAFWVSGRVEILNEKSMTFACGTNGPIKRLFYRNIVDCSDKCPAGVFINGFGIPDEEDLERYFKEMK